MRFIHIADVHLGAEPDAGRAYTAGRPGEIWDALARVTEICGKEKTDILLIAGDLFHRQPLYRELKELDYLFSQIPDTKVVLIAGNHDYIRKDSYYLTFPWSGNVFPLFGRTLEYVEFPELCTAVYGLSYHSREIREPLYDGAKALGIQKHEILLAHGGDEKHIPFDRGRLSVSGFDYVALGHIHRPQGVVKNQILYSGALEPVAKSDVGPHGFVKGEITEDGVKASWIPCASREYVPMEIEVDGEDTNRSVIRKIMDEVQDRGMEHMYLITLRGRRSPDLVFDVEHMDRWGNVLEVVDGTQPEYDFDRLLRENEGNILGEYIRRFQKCEEGGREQAALYEGVSALMAGRGVNE